MAGQHARLAASAASRWMVCAGSVKASDGMPDTTSFEAAQGTVAHWIGASALLGTDPAKFLGETHVEDGHQIDVDQEMIDAVRVYVDECKGQQEVAERTWIEQNFDDVLQTIDPDLGGTADFVAYAAGTLYVTDFKYGQGVFVDANDNKQLKMYALGALLRARANGFKVGKVVVCIVQPRVEGAEPVRHVEVDPVELMDFVADVKVAAPLTRSDNPPLVPSREGCKWCKARRTCPALVDMERSVMEAEFSDVRPYDPLALSKALDMIPILEAKAKAVKEFAYLEAQRGRVPPGYKLVEKRATRKWVGKPEVVPADWMEEPALKSPAQVEKLIGKKKFAEACAPFVEAKSSGTTLVPDSDSRREALPDTTARDFEAIAGPRDSGPNVPALFQ